MASLKGSHTGTVWHPLRDPISLGLMGLTQPMGLVDLTQRMGLMGLTQPMGLMGLT